MAIIAETGQAILNPLVNIWHSFVELLPGLIGALVVLLVGYLVGWIIGFVVKKVLHKAKVDKLFIEKKKLSSLLGKFQLSEVLGLIVKWYVFVLFLTPAASLIKLTTLSEFLVKLSLWIPNLIAAILVAIFGMAAAEYVQLKIELIKAKSSALVGNIAKILIIVFTAIIALKQIGLNLSLAENSVLIVLAGVMLALAIGFGLALKDELKPFIKDVKKRI